MSDTAPQTDALADDEFRFLAGDAARVARTGPLPAVERVRIELGEGAEGPGSGPGERRAVSGLRFGAPADPELVALHGAGLNAHSFDPMLLALDAPALALDLPGHGRSDWRADADYRPELIAPDIASAIARIAPRPVTLLGHSLGGLTAALVAAARPDLVTRLIVVDITPGVSPSGDAGSVAEFISGKRDYGTIDEIVDRAIEFGIGSDRGALARGVALNTRRRPDGRLEWTHHFAHLDALPGAGDADPLPYAPLWQALASLEIPVTQIAAGSGVVGERLAREWRDRLPGSDVVTLAGPHNLHEAVPVELAATVRELMRGR